MTAVDDAIQTVESSGLGAKLKLPLKSLLRHGSRIASYHYHPRVLEAWVDSHIDTAQENERLALLNRRVLPEIF